MGNRRLDIQGLRAVAVLAVVGYHAGLPLPGGFVGVDVFFVISGYVITRMLRREHERTGRIDFAAFYLRRFKRLTPALATMVGVTAAFSALALSPLGAQQRTAETGGGAIVFAANWVIAHTTGGYFDAPAGENPFLHTWSLSVEEQFYLAFPALLALGWRLGRGSGNAVRIVSAVSAVSVAAALVGTNPFVHSWLLGFYSPVTRAWEFGAGALLALAAARVVRPSVRAVAGVGGAALVAASLVLIDASTPFPGVWTVLPVTGAVLVIAAGGGPVSRLLASRPLVAVGDLSYSIYLWHWPMIVFARLLWPEAAHAPLLAALCSFVPAAASARWVETPLRTPRPLPRRRFAAIVALTIVSPVAVDAALGSIAPEMASRSLAVANRGDLGQRPFYRSMTAWSYPCADISIRAHALRWDGYVRCQQSKPGSAVDVALLGDSHAEQLFVGVARSLPRRNVAYYVVDDAPVAHNTDFEHILDRVVRSRSITTVLVSAFWYQRGVQPAQLRVTLERLVQAHKHVFVTDDVPFFPFEPFGCKYRPALLMPTHCSTPARVFWQKHARYAAQLRAVVRDVPSVRLLRTARWICSATRCDMARDGRMLYRDSNHLDTNGSDYVGRLLVERYASFRNDASR